MRGTTEYIKGKVSWCMLFAGALVLVGESPEEVIGRLEEWRNAFENKWLKISRGNTGYNIEYDFRKRKHGEISERQIMKLIDNEVGEVERYKYLGSIRLRLQEIYEIQEKMWMNEVIKIEEHQIFYMIKVFQLGIYSN